MFQFDFKFNKKKLFSKIKLLDYSQLQQLEVPGKSTSIHAVFTKEKKIDNTFFFQTDVHSVACL